MSLFDGLSDRGAVEGLHRGEHRPVGRDGSRADSHPAPDRKLRRSRRPPVQPAQDQRPHKRGRRHRGVG